MLYNAFEPGLQILGQALYTIADGFGAFRSIAAQYFLAEGVGSQNPDGTLKLDLGAWYPVEAELRVMRKVEQELGSLIIFNAGKKIPENAAFPPSADIHTGLAAIDIAYHMNHGKNGRPLFDPATGRKSNGIGSLAYRPSATGNGGVLTAHTFYPDEFIRGLIVAMAAKFKPQVRVQVDPSQPSISKGGETTTWLISW
ncbi:hypothetical protein HPC49_03275 [Pyxidicoccus fallax]|uniref:Uncharacterized protein n=1 Tax=Pyxidicoccus fallax TaxID=394095 RepID=A0A848L953_9BACT|nr:hypothetical protein [Pyxidicoccus fallax]NMO15359.1 hypothetical protein [Pyxidicoccus fallax]NPC77279.1 hypothetical protein [Pyxidicoccus fallax]